MASKNENNNAKEQRYIDIITSIVGVAAKQVDGVASVTWEAGSLTDAFSKSRTKKNTRSIAVEILNDFVIVDISINAKLGHKVPRLVCSLQEKLIEEIEKATCYKVKTVNVNIVGVAF